jgi:hypothetical protein
LACQSTPTLLRDKNGTPRDFSCMPIRQYDDLYIRESYLDFSSLLDMFYSERESCERLRRVDGGLRQALKTLIARTRWRVESRRTDLLHAGSAFYDVGSYENLGEIVRIPATCGYRPRQTRRSTINAAKKHAARLLAPILKTRWMPWTERPGRRKSPLCALS